MIWDNRSRVFGRGKFWEISWELRYLKSPHSLIELFFFWATTIGLDQSLNSESPRICLDLCSDIFVLNFSLNSKGTCLEHCNFEIAFSFSRRTCVVFLDRPSPSNNPSSSHLFRTCSGVNRATSVVIGVSSVV